MVTPYERPRASWTALSRLTSGKFTTCALSGRAARSIPAIGIKERRRRSEGLNVRNSDVIMVLTGGGALMLMSIGIKNAGDVKKNANCPRLSAVRFASCAKQASIL